MASQEGALNQRASRRQRQTLEAPRSYRSNQASHCRRTYGLPRRYDRREIYFLAWFLQWRTVKSGDVRGEYHSLVSTKASISPKHGYLFKNETRKSLISKTTFDYPCRLSFPETRFLHTLTLPSACSTAFSPRTPNSRTTTSPRPCSHNRYLRAPQS